MDGFQNCVKKSKKFIISGEFEALLYLCNSEEIVGLSPYFKMYLWICNEEILASITSIIE